MRASAGASFFLVCFTSKVLRRLISPVYALGLRINIYIFIRLKGKQRKKIAPGSDDKVKRFDSSANSPP